MGYRSIPKSTTYFLLLESVEYIWQIFDSRFQDENGEWYNEYDLYGYEEVYEEEEEEVRASSKLGRFV